MPAAVEQAYAVINAYYASKDAERAVISRELVGRCFKTTSPDTFIEEQRWRCCKITDVDGAGHPVSVLVEVRLRRGVTFGIGDFIREPMQGWTEISTGELRRLAAIIPATELGGLI